MFIYEKFKENSLFEAVNNIEKLPFEYTGINNYWLAKYGDRCVLPVMAEMDIDTIARVIHDMYYNKWDIMYNNYQLDILEDGNKLEVTTRVVSDIGENTSTIAGENLHKVSAFDSDDLTGDNSDSENKTTKDNSKNDKTETVTTKGNSGNYTNDYIAYNKYLTKTQFFDMVCVDINNAVSYGVITLDI